MISIDVHPLLDLRIFVTTLPSPLGEMSTGETISRFFLPDAAAPLASSDEVRLAVRDLLRHGGFKPTGRSKPASEYLIRAAAPRDGEDGGPPTCGLSSINLAVDACNVVSLHSGLPISVVDLDLASEPFRVGITEAGATYVFNPSGQTMDVGRLLCLFDADGPCANGVKDSQRTKTHAQTRRTLSLIWGTSALPGRAAEAEAWYHDLLLSHGATVEPAQAESATRSI